MLDEFVVGEVMGHGSWSATIEPRHSAQVVRVMGELDISEAPIFESTIRQHVVAERSLVVDLSDCSYIDSTVISVFVRMSRTLGEALSVVAKPGTSIERIFRITNLHHQLNIVPSVDDD
jgi:anti-anti-sigma factor